MKRVSGGLRVDIVELVRIVTYYLSLARRNLGHRALQL